MRKKAIFDALVIGAGPVGLAMARALQLRGLSVCVCGQLPARNPALKNEVPDLRTAALFAGSIRFLHHLGIWQDLAAAAAPIAGIRIIDATGGLLRAPEQTFTAHDIASAELGFNIANPKLVDVLSAAVRAGDVTDDIISGEQPADQHPLNRPAVNLDMKVVRFDVTADSAIATLADGSTRAGRVAIAADGRKSIVRMAAGIEVKTWDLGQSAITAHFDHALPNDGYSTEIHTKTGPCTVVPLASHRSSLVWMDTTQNATATAALPDDAFIALLEARLGGLLGPIRQITARSRFPLSSMIADKFAANRTALIGEAAHAFPPIGAQGLNLGLRDAACLADHLADAVAAGHDPGSSKVLDRYASERWADVTARTYGVDVFNRSLGNRAAGLLRGALMHATNASPGIKRFLMERGLQPVGPWPLMMR